MPDCNLSIATEKGGHRVVLSIDSTVLETPPLEHMAFYVGVGVMVSIGMVELPIAVALTAGHLLIGLTNRPALRALGEALDEV